jgi:gamma-glutamylcyclotransferase (GGCT)/AIG2-like uncharacterized protein YtfP
MSGTPPVRYRSPSEDSGRWSHIALRDGDIVISTRSKSGTTWMQMICALLVFQTPGLPAPLVQLSPWIDWIGTPIDQLSARLEPQQHRRFVKTHTPLDGVPLDPAVTYIVVARHPLDVAVSLYHQGENLDRERMHELTGAPPPPPRPPLPEWLRSWIDRPADPREDLDSLPGVMMHLSDAWARRGAGNVVLVHYDDLLADLEGQMRAIAGRLGIAVADDRWPELVRAASFGSMRERAEQTAPDMGGILKDRSRFFRRGTSGAGRAELSAGEIERYRSRCAELAPPDLLDWLHRDGSAGPDPGPAQAPAALFVYGTLMPGHLRWPMLASHAVGHRPAVARGRLYDSGRGWPIARLVDHPDHGVDDAVPGWVVDLDADAMAELMVVLDEMEGVDQGLYDRVVIELVDGGRAWAYSSGTPVDGLLRIETWVGRPER